MIPLQTYDLLSIGFGPAILFVGVMVMILWAGVQFRNPLGIFAWAFTIILFIFSGLFGLGFEMVWIAVVVTLVILSVGLIARVSQS